LYPLSLHDALPIFEGPAHEHRLDPAPRASIAGAHLRERDVALDRDRGRDRPHEQDGKHEEPACREELDDWIEDFHMRTSRTLQICQTTERFTLNLMLARA